MFTSKNIVIIGAGQIGSRHLQAVARIDFPARIWVVDPSDVSLATSKDRFNQVAASSNVVAIHYQNSIDPIPDNLNVVVVATNANIRLSVLKELLNKKTVKNLVLEKILFQSIEQLNEAAALLEEKGVPAWVNCPRRMHPFYSGLRERVSGKIKLRVKGKDWGLACNAIHFIDLFSMLSNNDQIIIDSTELDCHILKSKRVGFIEVTGRLLGKTSQGDCFELQSSVHGDEKIQVIIETSELVIRVNEVDRYIVIRNKLTDLEENYSYETIYQSNLTHMVVNQLVREQKCALTPYFESSKHHAPFLESISNHLEKATGDKNPLCPIT